MKKSVEFLFVIIFVVITLCCALMVKCSDHPLIWAMFSGITATISFIFAVD